MATTNWQYEYDKECVSSSLITNDMGKDINYGQPLIAYCNELMTKLKLNFNKVLVIGSGPGYTSFLLAKSFTEVLGIDYSGRLIDIATQFKTQGTFAMCGKMKIDCPLPAGSYSTDNATFKQLTWLPNELENFDLVLFDMIDRVMEPKGGRSTHTHTHHTTPHSICINKTALIIINLLMHINNSLHIKSTCIKQHTRTHLDQVSLPV
jgi:SAM-dependent methyltransferase